MAWSVESRTRDRLLSDAFGQLPALIGFDFDLTLTTAASDPQGKQGRPRPAGLPVNEGVFRLFVAACERGAAVIITTNRPSGVLEWLVRYRSRLPAGKARVLLSTAGNIAYSKPSCLYEATSFVASAPSLQPGHVRMRMGRSKLCELCPT
mmetsp:Transcript_174649/g.554303  ORF Transcript_174649/g.554303 Transcript_174649/m.554303 type:complete len:150 (-) Transcript_174649:449-898(-)